MCILETYLINLHAALISCILYYSSAMNHGIVTKEIFTLLITMPHVGWTVTIICLFDKLD